MSRDLWLAIQTVQKKALEIQRTSENPYFKHKYVDLHTLWTTLWDSMEKSGLLVTQEPSSFTDGCLTLCTRIIHLPTFGTAPENVRHGLYEFYSTVPVPQQDAQGLGSAITYMRRYALMAFFGVAPEDDDGNAASRPQGQPSPPGDSDWMSSVRDSLPSKPDPKKDVEDIERQHTKPPPEKDRALTALDPIEFGKHKGTPYGDLPTDYLAWLANNARDAKVKAVVDRILSDQATGKATANPDPPKREDLDDFPEALDDEDDDLPF